MKQSPSATGQKSDGLTSDVPAYLLHNQRFRSKTSYQRIHTA